MPCLLDPSLHGVNSYTVLLHGASSSAAPATPSRSRAHTMGDAAPVVKSNSSSKNSKTNKNHTKTHKIRNQDKFRFFGFYFMFYQICYNGLDLSRFCVPDRIIEKSNSQICLTCWGKLVFEPGMLFLRKSSFQIVSFKT